MTLSSPENRQEMLELGASALLTHMSLMHKFALEVFTAAIETIEAAGCVVVPVEPTEAMQQTIGPTLDKFYDPGNKSEGTLIEGGTLVYRAMLPASPFVDDGADHDQG